MNLHIFPQIHDFRILMYGKKNLRESKNKEITQSFCKDTKPFFKDHIDQDPVLIIELNVKCTHKGVTSSYAFYYLIGTKKLFFLF